MDLNQLMLNELRGRTLLKDISIMVKPYYDKNDSAHKWNHAMDVMDLSAVINEKYSMWHSRRDVLTAALLHDIGISWGRDRHHLAGYELLAQGELQRWFYKLTDTHDLSRDDILNAILEHRASYKGEFSSPLSELISISDRGNPSIETIVCRLRGAGNSLETCINHIRNKYAVGGYAKYPKIYIDFFGDRFVQFQKDCANPELITKLYNTEHVELSNNLKQRIQIHRSYVASSRMM